MSQAVGDRASLDAPALALEAMKIAAGICLYTNAEIVVESL